MKLLHCLVGFALALQLGCETEASTPPVEKVAAASLTSAQALQTKKATPPPADKIKSRPKPAQYKWGCNYNTSCKANCEWCGINGTCTCRLKGID